MKKIIISSLLLTIFLSIICSCGETQTYKFEKIDYLTSLGYRYCYLKSDTSLIRKLFSEKMANVHLKDSLRFDSEPVGTNELDGLENIFGQGKVPKFDDLINPESIDGYRVHIGVDTDIKNKTSKIALILTFGKQKYKPKSKEVFLKDSLELGIYRIILPSNFKYPLEKNQKASHFSCNPDCMGDQLR